MRGGHGKQLSLRCLAAVRREHTQRKVCLVGAHALGWSSGGWTFLDIPQRADSGVEKGAWVPQGRVGYIMQLLLCPSSPWEYHTNCKAGLRWGGLGWGGILAICELDLVLRCVLFGLHRVLKET